MKKVAAATAAAAPLFLMFCSYCVSVWFLSAGIGFSFRVKALRFIFKAFSIRFVYACSLHVPFIFPCPIYLYIGFNWFKLILDLVIFVSFLLIYERTVFDSSSTLYGKTYVYKLNFLEMAHAKREKHIKEKTHKRFVENTLSFVLTKNHMFGNLAVKKTLCGCKTYSNQWKTHNLEKSSLNPSKSFMWLTKIH